MAKKKITRRRLVVRRKRRPPKTWQSRMADLEYIVAKMGESLLKHLNEPRVATSVSERLNSRLLHENQSLLETITDMRQQLIHHGLLR